MPNFERSSDPARDEVLQKYHNTGAAMARDQHITNSDEYFGMARDTEQLQEAADLENEAMDAGIPPGSKKYGNMYASSHAEKIAEEVTSHLNPRDPNKRDYEKAAAHGAQQEIYHIEDTQRAKREYAAKREAERAEAESKKADTDHETDG